MRSLLRLIIIFLVVLLVQAKGWSQEPSGLYTKVYDLPDKFFGMIGKKSSHLQERLQRSTQQYVQKLRRREHKLQKRLARKDSAAAKRIFGNIDGTYDQLQGKLSDSSGKLQTLYSSRIDSMKTVLGFLQHNQLLSTAPAVQEQMQGALNDYNSLQQKFNQTDAVRKAITERQQYLQQQLQGAGLGKYLNKYKEQVYYYREQLDAYKRTLEDPQKLEQKLLQAVAGIPAFKNFFNKYSQLGSIFRLPGADDNSPVNLGAMQTRELLMQELQQRMGSVAGMQQAVSQGMNDARAGMDKIKDRISTLGASGEDLDMPDFKPNNEKSKSFLKRLETGINIQSVKSSYFFPSCTDLGLSLGYKISSKAIAGVGGSYKVGWGKDFRHIRITHEGIGLRTFVDIKLKGSVWITGGGEFNYQKGFKDFDILKDFTPWQKSALLGISKKYQLKKMKGSMQVMYDFLHNRQMPATQPIVFRVGYQFKK